MYDTSQGNPPHKAIVHIFFIGPGAFEGVRHRAEPDVKWLQVMGDGRTFDRSAILTKADEYLRPKGMHNQIFIYAKHLTS